MAVFLWVLAVCIVLLWLFLRPGRYGEAQKQLVYGVNHAHRGLHTKDKTVPENSLPAFRAAAEAGYGVELDIQLSRDGQVVVFHDDTLDRVCGVHGRVDEGRSGRHDGLATGVQQLPELVPLDCLLCGSDLRFLP